MIFHLNGESCCPFKGFLLMPTKPHAYVPNIRQRSGVTLIEVIAVLLILAIIGAVILSRANNTQSFTRAGELEKVKNHLRYAQIRSTKTTLSWGINFLTGSSYQLVQGGTAVTIPGEAAAIVTLSALQINTAPQLISFDALGSPGPSNIVITTNIAGTSILITGQTGFIP